MVYNEGESVWAVWEGKRWAATVMTRNHDHNSGYDVRFTVDNSIGHNIPDSRLSKLTAKVATPKKKVRYTTWCNRCVVLGVQLVLRVPVALECGVGRAPYLFFFSLTHFSFFSFLSLLFFRFFFQGLLQSVHPRFVLNQKLRRWPVSEAWGQNNVFKCGMHNKCVAREIEM